MTRERVGAPPGRDALVRRVREWMTGALRGAPPAPFDEVALAVHAWQHAHDPVLAALSPQPARALSEIPAVPVDLFKAVAVGTVQPDAPHVAFRTSGTTTDARGVHRLHTSELYDHGALAWANHVLPHRPRPTVALLLDPATTPDSSLAHMAHHLAEGAPASFHAPRGSLDIDTLDAALRAAQSPVFLPATAFAAADWLDALETSATRARPQQGSMLMITGGFKGRREEVPEPELLRRAAAALPGVRVVLEYGMTELSSQGWAPDPSPSRPTRYLLPPWLQAVALDPATGAPRPPGTPGQLRLLDLANVDSTLAVDTLDHATVWPAQAGVASVAVEVHGRLPGAALRGCSLTVEEARAAGRGP